MIRPFAELTEKLALARRQLVACRADLREAKAELDFDEIVTRHLLVFDGPGPDDLKRFGPTEAAQKAELAYYIETQMGGGPAPSRVDLRTRLRALQHATETAEAEVQILLDQRWALEQDSSSAALPPVSYDGRSFFATCNECGRKIPFPYPPQEDKP